MAKLAPALDCPVASEVGIAPPIGRRIKLGLLLACTGYIAVSLMGLAAGLPASDSLEVRQQRAEAFLLAVDTAVAAPTP
jgi:hypothetical protein